MAVMTNEIKKGETVMLKDGTKVKVMDNLKGNIRLIEAPMVFDPRQFDIGSAYVFDWAFVRRGDDWHAIELTPAQKKARDRISFSLGGEF